MNRTVLAIASALTIVSPVAASDTKAELSAAGATWNAHYAAGDWTAMRRLYTDDAWLMTDKATIAKGADAIIAFLRRHRDLGATVTFRFENEDVQVDRNIGTVVAKFWMTAQMPGKPTVRAAGRSVLIYRRDSGLWKLWRDIDNTTPDVEIDATP